MKIVTYNKAYVQTKDVSNLMGIVEEKQTSQPVFNKIFSNSFPCDNSNKYEFIEFSLPEEIEFFKKIDCLVDYLELKNLTEKELVQYENTIISKRNDIIKRYNAMNYQEKIANAKLLKECEMLNFKMYSVRDVLFYKKGIIKTTLPDIGIEDQVFKEEKGIKKLIKSPFNKKSKYIKV